LAAGAAKSGGTPILEMCECVGDYLRCDRVHVRIRLRHRHPRIFSHPITLISWSPRFAVCAFGVPLLSTASVVQKLFVAR
jgi:hypothetical protein